MIDATGLSNLGLHGGAYYWSSTEIDADYAWEFGSSDGSWYSSPKNGYEDQVRACLAF